MWWNIAAQHRQEFGDWHTHEHFPERMAIPGFLRGTRWADIGGGEGFFVMYELDDYATLTSDAYLERLNNPTPWSTKMMPHHQGMVRSQCRVLGSQGSGIGGFALTLRLSPLQGRDQALRAHLDEMARAFVRRPGGVACHLLRTETPRAAQTLEQRIRGGVDAAADWIVVMSGYDADMMLALQRDLAQGDALQLHGSGAPPVCGLYRLACSAAAG